MTNKEFEFIETAARELCRIRGWKWDRSDQSVGDPNFERNNAIREVRMQFELYAAIEFAKAQLTEKAPESVSQQAG